MANPISVSITNESTTFTIQKCILFHSATPPELMGVFNPTAYSDTMTVNYIGPGGHSEAVSMSSEWSPGDYWFGVVQYSGDPTNYYICGYASAEAQLLPPYKECNVPSGGSARFAIKIAGNSADAAYMYVNNADGSSDGGANVPIMDSTALIVCDLVVGLAKLIEG